MAEIRCWVFITFILLVLSRSDAARILVYFPTPSISHQVVYRPLTQELVRRGHEVTVITTDPAFPKGMAPKNFTEIDVHDVSYNHWKDLLKKHTGNKEDIMKVIRFMFERFATVLDVQLQESEVQELLKKDRKHFDLLILEAINRPLLGIAHHFDAPVIQASSFGAAPLQYFIFGAPTHPLLYPTLARQRLYNLTMFEKCMELFRMIVLDYMIASTEEYDYGVMKKHFGEDVPRARDLVGKLQMLFLNEHQIWADNHPVPPSIVYLGGIHQTVSKPLPQDLQNYLDSSKNGTIYVSFGTNVLTSSIPQDKVEMMTKVFSQLPYNILWKWDNDTHIEVPKNVKISTWFPQADVLKHPKIKLFITQAGLQSTDEAIDAGVPVLAIPMLGDQWYNAEKYVHHKIGLQLDMLAQTEHEFKGSIETLINDKSFKNNMLRLRSLMRDAPVKPLDNAVWWTEHIIKHGGRHIQSPAAKMYWVEYYEIKLVVIVLTILSVTLGILLYILKSIFQFIYRRYRISLKVKTH